MHNMKAENGVLELDLALCSPQERALKRTCIGRGRKSQKDVSECKVETQKWRKNSQTVLKMHQLEKATASDQRMLKGLSRTDRVLDLIDVGFAWFSSKEGATDSIYIDVSQDVGHKPWSRGFVRSLTTSSEVYDGDSDRILLPQEHLALLGFGAVTLGELSHRQIRDLAGESMSPPCVGLVLLSMAEVLLSLDNKTADKPQR